MKDYKRKTISLIYIFIYISSIASLGAIITVSLLWPRDNLLSWQMFLGVMAMTALFMISFVLYEKFQTRFAHLQKVILIFVILYGASLYFVSCIGRNEPRSLVDYGIIWDSAWNLAKNSQMSSEWYFLQYSNNIKPMLILSFLFKIAFNIGMEDPFYFVLLISVFEVLAALWAINVLIKNDRFNFSIPLLMFFFCFLPIWSNTQAFYTDSLSFCFSVVVLALLKKAYISTTNKHRDIFSFVAGILLALGVTIKITVCIPVIALVIVVLLSGDKSTIKKSMYAILFVGIGFVIMYSLGECLAYQYEIARLSKKTADPIVAWVALGLKGDGSFYQNREFVYEMQSLSSKTQKTTFSLQYIWENKSYFLDFDHLLQKIRRNYASGHFGNTDYTYYAKYENNILWQLFAPYGQFYWRTSQISFCYIHSMYIICFVGNILTLVQFLKEKKFSMWLMIFDLSMLGYFIFLMLWEANDRQLYNSAPLIIAATALHSYQIMEWVKNVFLSRIAQKHMK